MVRPVFYALYFLNFYNYPQCTDYFNNQGRRETRLTQGVPCATTPAPAGRDLDLRSLGLEGYPQAAGSGFTFNSNTTTTTTSNPSLFFHFSSSNPQATASSPSQNIKAHRKLKVMVFISRAHVTYWIYSGLNTDNKDQIQLRSRWCSLVSRLEAS